MQQPQHLQQQQNEIRTSKHMFSTFSRCAFDVFLSFFLYLITHLRLCRCCCQCRVAGRGSKIGFHFTSIFALVVFVFVLSFVRSLPHVYVCECCCHLSLNGVATVFHADDEGDRNSHHHSVLLLRFSFFHFFFHFFFWIVVQNS